MRWSALALTLSMPATALAGPRTPIWPTEVARVAAPLREVGPGTRADDRERVKAVQDLQQFSTAAITRDILQALDDPSMPVRREALGVCYARQIRKCAARAAKMWRDGRESTLRIAALRVIAMAPAGHAGLLRDALRDRAETVRSQAAQFLGWAPLSPEERGRARSALLIKLSDLSAVVRNHVVDSLGLIGDGDAVLPIARLLDDPEPTVRAAAATALARLHDHRAVPPLRRALEAPNEPLVTKAIVRALAQLGTDEVEQDLLDLLDDPPQGLDAPQIADAIGRRPDPGRVLVEGLVERLREPGLREPALDALELLGDSARARLKAAASKGLEAPLQAEIEALLGEPGMTLPQTPTTPTDPAGWRAWVRRPALDQRLEGGAELGATAPAWLARSIEGELVPDVPLDRRRGWLAALATMPSPIETETLAPWVVLAGWIDDPTRGDGDRCLAAAAASAAGTSRARRLVAGSLRARLSDLRDGVRACAALALGRLQEADDVALALADPSARVRVAAALALVAAEDLDGDALARLRLLAVADPDGHVRRAARVALELRDAKTPTRPAWHLDVGPEYRWADPTWHVTAQLPAADATEAGTTFELPAYALGPLRFAWAPALPAGVEFAESAP